MGGIGIHADGSLNQLGKEGKRSISSKREHFIFGMLYKRKRIEKK